MVESTRNEQKMGVRCPEMSGRTCERVLGSK